MPHPALSSSSVAVVTGGASGIGLAAAKAFARIGLEAAVRERFGGTDVLMNNAGVQPGSAMFGPRENWERVLSVNLWGVINAPRCSHLA